MPTALTEHCSTAHDGKIYTFGGCDLSLHVTDLVQVYDIASGTWTTGPRMPVPAAHPSATVLDDTIYVIGGFNGSNYQASVQIYDPATGTWKLGTDMLEPVDQAAFDTYNDKLYVYFLGSTYVGTLEPPPVIEATVDVDPDTLNLKSKGRWITCYIELPEGYNVDDIDVSTIMLNDQVPAELHPTEIGDYDADGIADLMVKFGRSAVQAILEVGDAVEITVTGELTDGTLFEGNDTIRVIDKGGKKK